MAAEQDFLPYAVGGSANVLSQTAYAALTTLLQNGLTSGIVPSNELNKIMRQPSIMASVLAQFIVAQTGQPAIDDGTTATLLANLLAAVNLTSAPVGAVRNLSMSVTAASASGTLTADEIVVETSLGGLTYKLASFSKTINLATTGAGGMDTGSPPVSGAVAIYAIYNPTTGTGALLAQSNVSVPTSVYTGAAMPAGFTASALVSIRLISGSQFTTGFQQNRKITIPLTNQNSSSAVVTNQLLVMGVPLGTIGVDITLQITNATASTMGLTIKADTTNGFGSRSAAVSSANQSVVAITDFRLLTQQSLWFSTTNSAGTPSYLIQLIAYTF